MSAASATRTLAELAQLVGGVLQGDGNTAISGASPLSTAAAGDLTLLDSAARVKKLAGTPAAAAIVPAGTVVELPSIEVADVHAAFAKLIQLFHPTRARARRGVSQHAIVSPMARLADDVDVYPHCVIEDDVEIGAGSTIYGGVHIMAGSRIAAGVVIYPNAVLYENTIVGPRSIIHAAAVLGAFGFGYRQVEGKHVLTGQLGYVELGCDVEIGAGTTIDRGTYGPTRIGDGTKIDDQVMVGHNVVIGRHNLICSQVGIAGSTTTGDYVVIAGQAGLRDHIHIGTGAILSASAGVINDVPDGVVMMGIPATPEREQKLKQVAWAKLPEMRTDFKALQRTVAELEAKLAMMTPAAKPADQREAA
ncbi:MAG: UDP-3-O-(3-hydroxymyristoyl)glucosamine N-acyltransferase [Pirellula sp.]|nr:UDP-3-O-(3-hydroxymyristoyl)glucosamine N-acyltransferase [Pirellula sp.]